MLLEVASLVCLEQASHLGANVHFLLSYIMHICKVSLKVPLVLRPVLARLLAAIVKFNTNTVDNSKMLF